MKRLSDDLAVPVINFGAYRDWIDNTTGQFRQNRPCARLALDLFCLNLLVDPVDKVFYTEFPNSFKIHIETAFQPSG